VAKTTVLRRYGTASLCNWFPTFRDNILASYSRYHYYVISKVRNHLPSDAASCSRIRDTSYCPQTIKYIAQSNEVWLCNILYLIDTLYCAIYCIWHSILCNILCLIDTLYCAIYCIWLILYIVQYIVFDWHSILCNILYLIDTLYCAIYCVWLTLHIVQPFNITPRRSIIVWHNTVLIIRTNKSAAYIYINNILYVFVIVNCYIYW